MFNNKDILNELTNIILDSLEVEEFNVIRMSYERLTIGFTYNKVDVTISSEYESSYDRFVLNISMTKSESQFVDREFAVSKTDDLRRVLIDNFILSAFMMMGLEDEEG